MGGSPHGARARNRPTQRMHRADNPTSIEPSPPPLAPSPRPHRLSERATCSPTQRTLRATRATLRQGNERTGPQVNRPPYPHGSLQAPARNVMATRNKSTNKRQCMGEKPKKAEKRSWGGVVGPVRQGWSGRVGRGRWAALGAVRSGAGEGAIVKSAAAGAGARKAMPRACH